MTVENITFKFGVGGTNKNSSSSLLKTGNLKVKKGWDYSSIYWIQMMKVKN